MSTAGSADARRFRRSSLSRRAVAGMIAVGALAAAVFGAVSARATTGENGELPEPPAKYRVASHIGSAFTGRFYMATVGRAAHLIAARIDILWSQNYESNDYLLGEIQLRYYGSKGSLTTTGLYLYPWQYSASKARLGANVIPTNSVSEKNPTGTEVGRLSFVVPNGAGTKKKLDELKTLKGELTLGGHGPYVVEFQRERDTPEQARVMRPAKQVGKA